LHYKTDYILPATGPEMEKQKKLDRKILYIRLKCVFLKIIFIMYILLHYTTNIISCTF